MGARILLTRSTEEPGDLSRRLEELGALVRQIAVLEVVPPGDPAPLRRALELLESFDWVIFTSRNGVAAVVARLEESGTSALLRGRRIAAVGASTAGRLEETGVEVDLIPRVHDAGGLLEAMRRKTPGSALLPQSSLADPALASGLRACGFRVTNPVAYDLRVNEEAALLAARLVGERLVDVLLATSPSALRAVAGDLGGDTMDVPVTVIGRRTAQAARKLGLRVDAIASSTSAYDIAMAVRAALGTGRGV